METKEKKNVRGKLFIMEYNQLKSRYDNLRQILIDFDARKSGIKLNAPVRILRKQEKAMAEYLYCLEVRAAAEGIELIK